MNTTTSTNQNQGRTKCEIWTRVMGYQRPVDFYNIGKKSEFYSRKYFQESTLFNNKLFNQKFSPQNNQSDTTTQDSLQIKKDKKLNYLLFTTSSCSKCPSFKKVVTDAINFTGKVIDETNQNFQELAQQFKVSSVPMLVVLDQNNHEIMRTAEATEVMAFER